MPTTIDTTSNPLAAYGYDANTGQQLATQLGVTPAQLAAAFAATPTSPGGGRDIQATINQLQVMKASGMGTSPAAPGQPTSTPVSINGSYYGSGGSPTGSGNMTWQDIMNTGYGASDIATFKQHGWTPAQVMDSIQKGYAKPPTAATAQAASPQNAFGISTLRTDAQGNTALAASNGNQIWQDPSGNYFGKDASGKVTPISDTQAQALGFQSANPETQAQKQMAQIDPASEALRTQLAGSYAAQMSQAQNPTAAQYQSYLDMYKQVDPAGYAQRQAMTQQTGNQVTAAQGQLGQANQNLAQIQQYVSNVTGQAPTSIADALAKFKQIDPQGYASIGALNTSEDASLKQATDQLNLGSQLDPVTARQVEQQTRLGQAARGNVYGTPQMAEEAMTTGQAGLALQQQRQAAAQAAQNNMQSYLTSGATYGAAGNQLYNQGLANQQNAYGLQNTALGADQAALGGVQSALGGQQNWLSSGQDLGSVGMSLYQQGLGNLQNAQAGALNYLGSGQTPYQAGASYLNQANQNAAAAAQGGPVYQPAALGSTTQAAQIPQYGLDIGQQSQNWYNSLQAYSNQGGAATKNKGAAAATGALSGAASGAAAGTMAYPGIGTAIGAGVGALAGGASGYFS